MLVGYMREVAYKKHLSFFRQWAFEVCLGDEQNGFNLVQCLLPDLSMQAVQTNGLSMSQEGVLPWGQRGHLSDDNLLFLSLPPSPFFLFTHLTFMRRSQIPRIEM